MQFVINFQFMKPDQKISICGNVCSECPRYTATQANDIKALNELAELWFRLGFRPVIVNPEELKCNGCNRGLSCSHGLTDCKHLDNIRNCGECDYFPCLKINAVFEKTDKANEKIRVMCSENEYRVLGKAFLMKKHILTEISRKKNKHINRK